MAGLDRGFSRAKVASIKWIGIDKVLKNLNKEIEKIKGRTVQGMLHAGMVVKADSMKLTPVDTGNLRGSTYVVWGGGGARIKSLSEGVFKTGKSKSADKVAVEHSSKLANRVSSNGAIQYPFAEVGLTAFYSAFVHENMKASHKKVDIVGTTTVKKKKFGIVGGIFQAGQAKFLEQAFIQNAKRILRIIEQRARFK